MQTATPMSTLVPTKDNNNLMDFKVLSRYDDLFTDIFLDNLFLWFSTIKMNNDHRRPRVPNTKILDIIQRNILEKAKPADAVNELLEMDYFKHYIALKNQKQTQEFIQHMKRYLYIYMPNAGYEVSDTRRYGGMNGRRVEACLVATKDWQVGDEMRLLTGMIACLDPKDDAELKKGNRDFSVMWSTRKNCSCLFLGPARFANHDCNSNCKFISLGQNSITFKVVRDIKFGEEITVYYGKHYFGENNCECRCMTCESQERGHFATLETEETTPIDGKDEDQCSTRRSTRKRKPTIHEDYSPHTSSTQRRSKRASLEPLPKRNSIEDLIEEEEKQLLQKQQQEEKQEEIKMDIDKKEDPPVIKEEQNNESLLPPVSVSPATERVARLKVMSIDFLCGSSDEEMADNNSSSSNSTTTSPQQTTTSSPSIPEDRRVSDCPLLDLLVDAVMDAEYMSVKEQKEAAKAKAKAAARAAAAAYYKSQANNKQITVVVNPEIHRDATQRAMLHLQHSTSQHSTPQQPGSPLELTGSKADSAVSLSPRMLQTIKKEDREEDDCWREGLYGELSNKNKLSNNSDDNEDHLLDDFLDDVSDLSSISSTELSSWTTEEEEEEGNLDSNDEEEEVEVRNLKKPNNKKVPITAPTIAIQDLACIACLKPLKKQDISEQIGADMSITNELATWTWSPSAVFTDWRPKRCPRCERHFTIFKQEWPCRKIAKKKQISTAATPVPSNNNKKLKNKRLTKKKKSPKSPLTKEGSNTVNPTTTEPVYIIQDDPADLNYIPPSPLSEIIDEDDTF